MRFFAALIFDRPFLSIMLTLAAGAVIFTFASADPGHVNPWAPDTAPAYETADFEPGLLGAWHAFEANVSARVEALRARLRGGGCAAVPLARPAAGGRKEQAARVAREE
ncbi:MAG: hypothetical protein KGM17_14715 [Sphingomonadales bacterium]|nr:hypothetical protein [Sphingomonadales bacterium]